MIKAILFDFDGTLVDSKSAAFKTMARVLDEFNCRFSQNNMIRLMGIKEEIFFKEIGLNPAHLDNAKRKFWKYFKIKTLKENEARLCVPINPLVSLSKKYPLFVISNSETKYVKKLMRKLKIKKYFKRIYGGDKFTTKDAMLKKIFKKLKLMPHEAIYVGDRFSDIQFSRDAGCYAVAIHNEYSWSSLQTLKREKPDFLIKDFDGLKKIIENLNMDYYS